MAKLSSSRRKALPDDDFALAGRQYPIDTENRARDALSRVVQNGTPAEIAEVRRKVHARYPDIRISGMRKAKSV